MKKALQIPNFAGPRSVSEIAVGRGPREARSGGPGDRFAELRIADRGGPAGRRSSLLECSFANLRSSRWCCLRRRLRQRSRNELQTLRRDPAEAAQDLLGA